MKKSTWRTIFLSFNVSLTARSTNSKLIFTNKFNNRNLSGAKQVFKWCLWSPKKIPKSHTGRDWPNRTKNLNIFNVTGKNGSMRTNKEKKAIKDWETLTMRTWIILTTLMTRKKLVIRNQKAILMTWTRRRRLRRPDFGIEINQVKQFAIL